MDNELEPWKLSSSIEFSVQELSHSFQLFYARASKSDVSGKLSMREQRINKLLSLCYIIPHVSLTFHGFVAYRDLAMIYPISRDS
jgi:hypothetical protein